MWSNTPLFCNVPHLVEYKSWQKFYRCENVSRLKSIAKKVSQYHVWYWESIAANEHCSIVLTEDVDHSLVDRTKVTSTFNHVLYTFRLRLLIVESRERAWRGRGRRVDEERISTIRRLLWLPSSDVRLLRPAKSHVHRHLPLWTPAQCRSAATHTHTHTEINGNKLTRKPTLLIEKLQSCSYLSGKVVKIFVCIQRF